MRNMGEKRPWKPEHRPGHVLWMPQGATWLNRNKPRPFTMVTGCQPGTSGTLVYGSTQLTEAAMGAQQVRIDPIPTGVSRNGLRERTYFYPGVLVRKPYEMLPPHAGSVARHLEMLRAALWQALGIGQGSCRSPGAPEGSRRGRIVQLEYDLARNIRSAHAVLLTEPLYSRELRYHVILPIVPGLVPSRYPALLQLSDREWMAALPQRTRHVMLPIQVVSSVWYPRGVQRETEHVMDEDSLARIDRALCDYFSLPDPPAGG